VWALSFLAAYIDEGIYICLRCADAMGTAVWRNNCARFFRCPKQFADSFRKSYRKDLGGLDVGAQ
jgi:hypothetical protein